VLVSPSWNAVTRCVHSGDAETSDADYDERSEVFLANGRADQFVFSDTQRVRRVDYRRNVSRCVTMSSLRLGGSDGRS
jgi:hypothetical protein